MGYKGLYIWKLRQKVGRDRLLTVTVDVLPVNQAGQVKLAYVKEFDRWNTIGDHAEEGDSFRSAARRRRRRWEREMGLPTLNLPRTCTTTPRCPVIGR